MIQNKLLFIILWRRIEQRGQHQLSVEAVAWYGKTEKLDKCTLEVTDTDDYERLSSLGAKNRHDLLHVLEFECDSEKPCEFTPAQNEQSTKYQAMGEGKRASLCHDRRSKRLVIEAI